MVKSVYANAAFDEPSLTKTMDERKRYLAIIAVRYLLRNGDDTIHYDDAECDGLCLAGDIAAEWDITENELKQTA